MNYLKFSLITLVFVLPISSVYAQDYTSDDKLKKIESFVEKVMQDWEAPSVGLGIVKGDQVILAKGFGFRNLEEKLPADENTLYAIGSASKAFTALGVCQLADDDKLDLDKPIINYLPDFRMSDDYISHHMTPRDLLCHRSGLPRHDLLWYGAPDDRATLFSKLEYLEPNAGFREVFQYQNLMFMTAGYLTGKLHHSTWEEAMKSRIFEPLGMTRTNLSVEDSKKDANHAMPYREKEGETEVIPFRNIDAVGPAGSINSSPREMCNWMIMQLNGGQFEDKQVVSEAYLNQSHAPIMTVPDGWSPFLGFDNGNAPIAYGLGWFISAHQGKKIVEHGGTIDGFRTSVGLIPEDEIGVVVLVNKSGSSLPQIIRNYVLDLMLDLEPTDWNSKMLEQRNTQLANQEKQKNEEDKKQIKGTMPSHELAAYVGTFNHPAYGKAEIALDYDKLALKFHGLHMPLNHYHYDVFQTDDPDLGKNKIQFHFDIDGNVSSLSTALEPAVDDIIFEKVPDTIALAVEKLEAFLGEYEISGMQIKVWKKGENTLMMTVPGQPDYTLSAEKENHFFIEGLKGYKVSFEWVDDKVKAIILDQPNGVFTAQRVN